MYVFSIISSLKRKSTSSTGTTRKKRPIRFGRAGGSSRYARYSRRLFGGDGVVLPNAGRAQDRRVKIGYDRALAGYWVDEMKANGFDMCAESSGGFTWSQPMKRELGRLSPIRKSITTKSRFALVQKNKDFHAYKLLSSWGLLVPCSGICGILTRYAPPWTLSPAEPRPHKPRHVRQSAETTVAVATISTTPAVLACPYRRRRTSELQARHADTEVYNNAIACPVSMETGRLTAVCPINLRISGLLGIGASTYCRFTRGATCLENIH